MNAIARELAEEGFRVFTIPGRRKAPPIQGWQERATADPAKAATISPDDNIGIACGDGLLILDLDGDAGARSLAALEAQHGKLPETCKVSTPSGGAHFYFSGPDVANSAGKIGEGLDVRGKGGYVVAPGSRTDKGAYTVAHAAEPAPAPQWLIDLCSRPRDKANAGEAVPDAPPSAIARALEWLAAQPPAVEGQGGDARTFATACGLRDLGASEAQAVELLAGEWNARCSPPWSMAELLAKAANAYRYSENAAGARVALPEDFPVIVQDAAAAAIERASRPRAKGGTLQEMARRTSSGAYLVKGLLRRKSHAVVYGAPGVGKSSLALDLAYHVAAGRDWMGRRVSQGPVLYLAFEGLGGMPERAAALLQHYGDAAVPMVIEPGSWNLREKRDREALGARMAEIEAAHFSGQRPALIVLDTLARCMAGGDENSAADMGALNEAVAALIEATEGCVMLLHHPGKDRNKGARGSSSLLGAVDTEIEVDGGRLTATKQREMELGAPIGFRLSPVVVGTDTDGDPLHACVVLPDASQGGRKAWKPTGQTADAWSVLCRLRPNNDPLPEKEWEAAFVAEAWPAGAPAEKSQKRAWRRVVKELRDRGKVELAPEGGGWCRPLK